MKTLVFGARGWIGNQFLNNTSHETIIANTRPENAQECYEEIKSTHPDCVISFIGRTYGKAPDGRLVSSIDYLELPGKLYENMRDNFYGPFNLAKICEELNIHFVYLGTGCIYTYTPEKKVFTEDDIPNFYGSQYSTVKGYTDQVLRHFKNTLQLRIRMPLSKLVSIRSFIDKIISYPNICSMPNSMSMLDDMWSIIDKMIEVRECGVYNFVNPGVADHDCILKQYKTLINPAHTWTLVSYEDQMKYIKSDRSNNEMSASKLEQFCQKHDLELISLQESILRCLQRRIMEAVD
jgi:3,5-epimerase/4-reductase